MSHPKHPKTWRVHSNVHMHTHTSLIIISSTEIFKRKRFDVCTYTYNYLKYLSKQYLWISKRKTVIIEPLEYYHGQQTNEVNRSGNRRTSDEHLKISAQPEEKRPDFRWINEKLHPVRVEYVKIVQCTTEYDSRPHQRSLYSKHCAILSPSKT